jgi:hypothetical protein
MFLKNWWRRASAASKTDAVLAIIAFLAKAYTVAFAVWMGGAKFSAWSGPGAAGFWIFALALAYVNAQPYLPKRASKKWVIEDIRRTKAVGVAVSRISSAIRNHSLKPEERQSLFMILLSAIQSEIEGVTGDHEGIYSNVSLLLNDNPDRLKVVCRANHDRPLKSYMKSDLLISKSLATLEVFYEPECILADKPYRAILGIPLVSTPENSPTLVSGIVSIDNAEAHCFDGLVEEIETKTLPYINLLKLVIIADEALNVAKRRPNARSR